MNKMILPAKADILTADKDIYLLGSNTIIRHHYVLEYDDRIRDYTLESFLETLVSTYKLAESLGWTRIKQITDSFIITEMPRYEPIMDPDGGLDCYFKDDKLLELLKELLGRMKAHKVMHSDFIPNNVGYDPNRKILQLLDLNSLILEDDSYKINLDKYLVYWKGHLQERYVDLLDFAKDLYHK